MAIRYRRCRGHVWLRASDDKTVHATAYQRGNGSVVRTGSREEGNRRRGPMDVLDDGSTSTYDKVARIRTIAYSISNYFIDIKRNDKIAQYVRINITHTS